MSPDELRASIAGEGTDCRVPIEGPCRLRGVHPRSDRSPFDSSLPILWIAGDDWLQDGKVWVPFQLVHTAYTTRMRRDLVGFEFSSTGLASGNQLRATAFESGMHRDDERVIDALGLDPLARDRAVAGALGWWLAREHAGRHGEATEAGGLVEQAAELCCRHELSDAAAVERWLVDNRFTRAELERLLEARAHAARAARSAGDVLLPTLLQYLRWTGEYARLLSLDPRSGPDRDGGSDQESGERNDPLTSR